MTSAFDRLHQLTMMISAAARYAAGNYFPLFSQKPEQCFVVLVIDILNIVLAEPAYSFFNSNHWKPRIEIDTPLSPRIITAR